PATAPFAPVGPPSPAGSSTAGFTPAGLPRRVSGGRPPEPVRRAPASSSAGHPPPGPPDPDAARARLSSLASGIAAAQRSAPGAATDPTG
ncbi:MAG TPA: hypothetical protein VES42_17660, partial [Pilimelia sp.]|nr:hypothetical protein [Pilimelia sp.]